MRPAILFAIILLCPVCFAATLHVPDDYPTIQEAIDVAANGDIILVAPDTYVENINFLGKDIKVKSEKGPGVTVINGNRMGSVVTFQSEESIDAILEGFHLTNGFSNAGGGILCENSAPTIVGNTISFNESGYDGGGILCNSSDALILNNSIQHNWAAKSGGGIWCGSGLSPSPTIINNLISSNIASGWEGGGIYVNGEGMSPVIINNTIVKNISYGNGGGFRMTINSPVCNTIVWGNQPDQIHGYGDVTFCDVQGGWPGTGNIDADPLFVESLVGDYHLTWQSGCRNAGNNSMVIEVQDFEGDPRIGFGTVDIGADEFYTHFYCTGDFNPNGTIRGKLVGLPSTSPVGLFIGTDILDPPLSHPWGNFYLKAPWMAIPLFPIPSNGVLTIPERIPPIPSPYDIPMQALIGWELSNLFVLNVR